MTRPSKIQTKDKMQNMDVDEVGEVGRIIVGPPPNGRIWAGPYFSWTL